MRKGHGFHEMLLEHRFHGRFNLLNPAHHVFDLIAGGFVQQCNSRTGACGVTRLLNGFGSRRSRIVGRGRRFVIASKRGQHYRWLGKFVRQGEAQICNRVFLCRVGARAIASGYLEAYPDSKIAVNLRLLEKGELCCSGEDCLVLCSLNPQEQHWNPGGSYYLQDGAARGLALWLFHLKHSEAPFPRVEALVALEPATKPSA